MRLLESDPGFDLVLMDLLMPVSEAQEGSCPWMNADKGVYVRSKTDGKRHERFASEK